ncbi:hypothetical protein [Pseudomonas mucidolens]|uniref:hypothetical protein n=1 Tax=Pseudomonas mucidolens TaxID=46679 RepID=UPI0030D839E4
MKINSHKKELLYRKAQGKKISKRFEKKLSNIFLETNEKFSRIGLLETDIIIEILKARSISYHEEKTFISTTECLNFISTEISGKEHYVLIDEDWKLCGAVRIGPNTKLNINFNFNENVSDELRFISLDFSMQVSVDYTYDHGDLVNECSIKKYTASQA